MSVRFASSVGALALWLSGGLTACGGQDVERFVRLDTEKAAAFAAGGDDCEAKARSVGEWHTAHRAEYKAMQDELDEAYPEGPPADVVEKHGEQLQKNNEAVLSAMIACAGNEAFGKMMDDTAAK